MRAVGGDVVRGGGGGEAMGSTSGGRVHDIYPGGGGGRP